MTLQRRMGPGRRLAALVGAVLIAGLAFSRSGGAQQEGRSCGSGPTDLTIQYGDLVNCVIRPAGEVDVFRFAGNSGETIRLQLADRTRGAATPCARLLEPDGTLLPDRICGDAGQDVGLQRTGTYAIEVFENPDDGEERVRYAVVAERIDPSSPAAALIRYDQTIASRISKVGDLDAYFFDGVANDRIAIRIVDRTRGAPAPCFELFDPTGQPSGPPVCGNANREVVLAAAGRHSILVTERPGDGSQGVRYRVRLACVAGACPDAGLERIFGCLALRGAPLLDSTVRFNQPDEAVQRSRTDVRGCVGFLPTPGKPFQVRLQGPVVPD